MSGLISSRAGDAAMHGDFMGFALDEGSLATLRLWAERQGHPRSCVLQGGLEMFASMLESAAPPKLVIVDIDGQDDPVAALNRLMSIGSGGARIIALGTANDISLYRRLTKAGAVDYLVKPLSIEQINQTTMSVLRGPSAAGTAGPKESRVIVVIGARGGVGASTLALNVAWLLGHTFAQTTALLDLDLQFGTGSLALDLEPARGLRDILSSPQRVDGLMISSALMPESPRFSVLAAEEPIDDNLLMDPNAITALIKELKGKFNAVVVDLPRFHLAAQKRLLTIAQEIVIVSDMSLAGIRDTLRIKGVITALACPGRLNIVAARTNSDGAGQVDAAAYEKGVQAKIDATIVENKIAVATASNSGKALGETAPDADITEALRALAKRLSNLDEAASGKPSLWAKLLGKAGRGGA